MSMTPERWRWLEAYSREVFGAQDDHLAGLMEEAVAAGLPDISVSPEVGRLLMMLTALTRARCAVEVGTLGGYSGIWIARGLRPEGRLTTIEAEPRHAEFAQLQFERAGVADRVEIRRGRGIDVLTDLVTEWDAGCVDVVFLDAVKSEYVDYLRIVRPLIAVGGLLLADNVYGTGEGWIDQGYGTDEFNRAVAADPDFESVALPIQDGVLVALRIR